LFSIGPISPWLIVILAVVSIAFLVFIIVYGVRAHRHQPLGGKEELIGKVAEAKTVMEPRGIVFVQGESWVAILDKGRAEPGEEVIITKVEGLKLRVTKKE